MSTQMCRVHTARYYKTSFIRVGEGEGFKATYTHATSMEMGTQTWTEPASRLDDGEVNRGVCVCVCVCVCVGACGVC